MYRFVSLGGLSRVVVVVEVVVGSVIQLAHYACTQVDGEIKSPGRSSALFSFNAQVCCSAALLHNSVLQ